MIVKSKFTIDIPQEPIHTTILRKCLNISKEDPKRAAFIASNDKSNPISFKQVYDYSFNLASWLMQNGFKKGDVVLLNMRTSWRFVVACLGAWIAGLIVSPASTMFTEYELYHQLDDSTAKLVITEELFLRKIINASGPRIKRIICVSTQKTPKVDNFMEIVTMQYSFPVVPVNTDMAEDVILLIYSSGTTGIPKGVMLTHRNYAFTMSAFEKGFDKMFRDEGMDGYVPPPYQIAFLPCYHIMGFFFSFHALYYGSTQITMEKFNLKGLLQHIQDYKIMHLALVPSVILAMADSPLLASYDLSSLLLILSGGAPLNQSVVELLRKRIPQVQVVQGYGMTEIITSHMPSLSKPGVGQLLANTEMKVISESGKLCGPNELGELWLRGPQVMKGYWRRPKLNKEMFDKDGFMCTGDIVYFDENGFTFICDRAKDLIKVDGRQVSPTEIEQILLTHPEISDCCVIGIPDKKHGELPLAYVVSKSVNESSIHAYVKDYFGVLITEMNPKMLKKSLEVVDLEECLTKRGRFFELGRDSRTTCTVQTIGRRYQIYGFDTKIASGEAFKKEVKR